MNRLRNRPTLNVSDKPKPKIKPVSIDDRRTRFSGLNKKSDDGSSGSSGGGSSSNNNNNDSSQVMPREERASADSAAADGDKDNSAPQPSASSLSLLSLLANRQPGQFAPRNRNSA